MKEIDNNNLYKVTPCKKTGSRRRINEAVNHKESDRVPIDLGGLNTSTLDRGALDKYMKYFALDSEIDRDKVEYINVFYQQCKVPEKILLDLHIDTRIITNNVSQIIRYNKDTLTFTDDWGTIYRKNNDKNFFYYEVIKVPLGNASFCDICNYAGPEPKKITDINGIRAKARWLYKKTDYAIVGTISGPNIVQQASINLRGLERFMIDMILEPKIASKILEKVLDIQMARWEIFLDEVGLYLDYVQIPDDLASQRGLLISPELYRKIIKPHQKRYFDFVKSKTKAKLIYHCCGSYYDLIPDLIKIGVDIFNPIQTQAIGMDYRKLKKEYGKETTFWGIIDTQKLLPFGTIEEIKTECSKYIEEMACGGGFVFGPSHSIQEDVPLANFLTMYESAWKYRKGT